MVEQRCTKNKPRAARRQEGRIRFGARVKSLPHWRSAWPGRALDVRDAPLDGAGAEAGAPAWPISAVPQRSLSAKAGLRPDIEVIGHAIQPCGPLLRRNGVWRQVRENRLRRHEPHPFGTRILNLTL